MSDVDRVLARLAEDPDFAAQVRVDPARALRGYQLDTADLSRLEQSLEGAAPAGPQLFIPANGDSGAAPAGAQPTSGQGAGALAAVLRHKGIAAGVAVLAAAAAGFGVGRAGLLGGSSVGATLRADAVSYYACSDSDGLGTRLGELHRGDRVWLVGRSADSRYLALRHPQELTALAWMPAEVLRDLGGDPATLPAISCEHPATAAASPTASTASTASTTAPSTPSTTTAPTTAPTAAPTTTPPSTTRPTRSTPPATTTTPTPTRPPADTTGPTVTLTANPTLIYSEGSAACAAYVQQAVVTVAASDPSGATLRSVRWALGAQQGAATASGPSTWRVGPIYSNHSGVATLTVTVVAEDGAGNTTTATTTVAVRQIAEVCIG